MGLSDGERYMGVICAIHRMSQIRFKESYNYRLRKINKLLKELWPTFQGNTSNNAHWIIGSDTDADHFSEVSFLGSAFKIALGKMLTKDNGVPFPFSPLNSDATDEEKEKQKKRIDRYKFFQDYRPSVVSLLEKENYDYANAYRLLQDIETYFYNANRYQDKFAKKLKSVNRLMAKIRGALWDEVSENPIYLRAWMVSRILDKIILDFDDDDIVAKWFRKHYLHHHTTTREVVDTFIYETFKKIQARPNVPIPAHRRVVMMLRFLGKQFHYEHQHRELLKMIDVWNEQNPNDQVQKAIVAQLCKVAAQNKKEEETKSRQNYYMYCNLTEQEITMSSKAEEDDKDDE